MKKTRKGYATPRTAYRAAVRRDRHGLTGSGQTCGPVYMDWLTGGKWAYKTWDNDYLIPGGTMSAEEVAEAMGFGLCAYDRR